MHVYQNMDWGVTQAARLHIAVPAMRIRLLCRTFTIGIGGHFMRGLR
jgi:hypothetical protein